MGSAPGSERRKSARPPRVLAWVLCALGLLGAGTALTALVVPTEIQQPGTQPGEVGNLESPNKCDNCHGGYDRSVEPAFNWRGGMMANAGRDPIFWATVAVAEQDFPGSGDLCIRCHSVGGWHAGRSIPTDGSGLQAGDADGVECDSCHKMTNPNGREHLGVMTAPFVANDEASPASGYYGSGMLALSGGTAKLGPYANVNPPHAFQQSKFHRDVDFCGSCHDVSNPAVGDLAHNQGKQPTSDSVFASGILGSLVNGKAAFNNFPYQYGVVERTFSEYKAGLLSRTAVSSYPGLPADLKAGAIKAAFEAAGGDYADGTTRYFSCQTCHMRPTTGQGCNKNPPVRSDLPLHDLTGGNTWAPDVILYQNTQGTLRLGGGLSATQIDAITAGKERARQQLQLAASLTLTGNTLRVTNLTGHKLISGYPEGRRMWLNIKWYDAAGAMLREDGKYGDLAVSTPGAPTTVKTILDLAGTNTRIYEAHYAMTQDWAGQLLSLGYPASMPLSFDRLTGLPNYTLGQLAAQAPGTSHETFHFVLNNQVVKDNRIPTYGMRYEEARKRNALPVPSSQYGNPGPAGTYDHWDEVALNPPANAHHATIDLLYQSTSWEYIQFLHAANNRSIAFLADEGSNLLAAWANTGMAAPVVMASIAWTAPPVPSYSLSTSKSGTGAGTITSSPAGISCGSDCSETYSSGTPVTLTAVPDATSAFSGWSGSCVGTGPCVVTMDAARSVTATFTRITYVLTTGKAGTGSGTVASSPAGISCGSDCSEAYPSGTPVTLTATPSSGSVFDGWTGACAGTAPCVVTMSSAKSVTAIFSVAAPTTFALTVSRTGTGGGTVASSPAGIDCGATCSASYVSGTVVTLTATPDSLSSFAGWSGACTGTAPCNVAMDGAKSVTAGFAPAVAPGALTLSPLAVDFGGQSMNTTAPEREVSITNTGGSPATITSVTVSTFFRVSHDCGILNAGAACVARLEFTPTQEGVLEGILAVASSVGTKTAELRGTGERSLITHYYRSILRRGPDADGKAYWEGRASAMQALGADVSEVWYAMAAAFFSSPEYVAFNRDDAGFVTDLYLAFLNRAPDASGLAYWTGSIGQGMPREVVLVSFMFSPEFASFTRAIFGEAPVRREIDMVMDFYRGLLARLPDEGGFNYWVGRFRAAQCSGAAAVYAEVEAISSYFANSPEYTGRNRAHPQFVGDLYNAFLRRGGDLDGVLYWISQLDTGLRSRENVRQQFVASPEFNARIVAMIAQECLP